MKPVDLEFRPALGFKGVIGDWRLAMRGTSASAQALVSALKANHDRIVYQQLSAGPLKTFT